MARELQVSDPPLQAGYRGGGEEGKGSHRGANPVRSPWEHVADDKGQIKTTELVVPQGRAARSWEAWLLIPHNEHCFSHVGEWGLARPAPPRPPHPAPSPSSCGPAARTDPAASSPTSPWPCTTLEGRSSEKMRRHVRHRARGRVCAAAPATRGARESGHPLFIRVAMWVYLYEYLL